MYSSPSLLDLSRSWITLQVPSLSGATKASMMRYSNTSLLKIRDSWLLLSISSWSSLKTQQPTSKTKLEMMWTSSTSLLKCYWTLLRLGSNKKPMRLAWKNTSIGMKWMFTRESRKQSFLVSKLMILTFTSKVWLCWSSNCLPNYAKRFIQSILLLLPTMKVISHPSLFSRSNYFKRSKARLNAW